LLITYKTDLLKLETIEIFHSPTLFYLSMNITKSIDSFLDNRKYIFTNIILASLFVQILFILVLGDVEKRAKPNDYINYYKPGAENILSGIGFVDDDGNLIVRYPPGYPLYLTLPLFVTNVTGSQDITIIRIFNVFTTAAATIFFFLLIELLFNTRIAFFSTFIWMTYPFHLWLIKAPNSEIPFLLFFFGGLWLYFRGTRNNSNVHLILSGVILGCAALIRPMGILLGVICCVALPLLRKYPFRRQIFRGSIVLMGFILAILPWEALVYVKTGEIIPLSKAGSVSVIDGLTFAVQPGVGGDQAPVPEDVMALMLKIENKEDLDGMSTIISYLIKEFVDNPAPVIKLFIIKLSRAWYATNTMWYENYILVIQLFYFITIMSGIIIAFKQYKEKIPLMLFILSIVVYFWGMSFLVLSILRYMVPVMALLLIFSAIVLDKFIKI